MAKRMRAERKKRGNGEEREKRDGRGRNKEGFQNFKSLHL